MRIIPKNTKVATEFFKGVSLWDVLVGAFGVGIIFFVVVSNLPYKLQICGGVTMVFVFLLVRIDEEPNYMFFLRILQHLSYIRRYRKLPDEAAKAEFKKVGSKKKDKKSGKVKEAQKTEEQQPEETEEEYEDISREYGQESGESEESTGESEEDLEAEFEAELEADREEVADQEDEETSEDAESQQGKAQKENKKAAKSKKSAKSKTTVKSKETAKGKSGTQKKSADIHRMFLIKSIHDRLIDYGSYFGAVLEIPPVEFRFFSEHRRTNAIDIAMGSVVRNVGSRYAANIVKIERPMILDDYIASENEKIEMLRRSYENGVYSDEELKARIELIYHRLDELERLNYDDTILVPHYYIALFDSDKRQLENQISTAISSLQAGEMHPTRLSDKELAVFLRYTNSVDFDEREIDNLDPADYVDFLLPDSLEFTQRTVQVNNIMTHNFRVSRFPLTVGDAWGANLFDIPGTKVVVKFSQMDRDKSIRAIDRSIGELNSQLDKTGVSSKVLELQTHIDTLSELLVMLQNDNECLVAMNFYITAYDIAMTRDNKMIDPQPPPSMLPRITSMKKEVRRNFTEKGFRVSDQSFQQLPTFVASQVNGYDPFVKKARGVPGSTLAAVFPWIFAALRDDKGINLGSCDGVPTFLDFFRRDSERVNSNMVIVGKSGGGKSYATKSILSNLAADDSKIFVLDPENEYTDLAENLNGKFINVANASQGRINPFQIITSLEDDEAEAGQETNSFSAHLQFLEEFFRQILPEINSDAMEYLNNLINRVYMRKGIDQYTNLVKLQPEDYPIFDDLYDCILEEFQVTQSDYLKNNLRVLMSYVAKFSTGGRNSNIWNGPSTLSTAENFIVFNFQALLANRNNTIANAQMLLVLKYLDNEIIKNREYNIKHHAKRKIIIVIDEAHVFIDSKYPLALDFMYQLAKRIRKYNGMQIVITQNIKDFVGSEELARKSTAIINACQYSFIFSLAPNDMHDLCKLYEKAGGISEIEQEQIMAAPRGRAFVVTGPTSRATLQIETPKPIEDMFSEQEYTRRYFERGDSPEWEEFIGESKELHDAEYNLAHTLQADVEDILMEETPDFHESGVNFIEVEEEPQEEQEEILLMDEVDSEADESEDVLLGDSKRGDWMEEVDLIEQGEDLLQGEETLLQGKESLLQEEVVTPGNGRRKNATAQALDLLHEEGQQQNAMAGGAGAFTQQHLAQLGFEALVSEIRRTVKEELIAELGLDVDEKAGTGAGKKKRVVRHTDERYEEEDYDSEDYDEEESETVDFGDGEFDIWDYDDEQDASDDEEEEYEAADFDDEESEFADFGDEESDTTDFDDEESDEDDAELDEFLALFGEDGLDDEESDTEESDEEADEEDALFGDEEEPESAESDEESDDTDDFSEEKLFTYLFGENDMDEEDEQTGGSSIWSVDSEHEQGWSEEDGEEDEVEDDDFFREEEDSEESALDVEDINLDELMTRKASGPTPKKQRSDFRADADRADADTSDETDEEEDSEPSGKETGLVFEVTLEELMAMDA